MSAVIIIRMAIIIMVAPGVSAGTLRKWLAVKSISSRLLEWPKDAFLDSMTQD